MSDPLHRALTELVERQRAELDELRARFEEYDGRHKTDQAIIADLRAAWDRARQEVKDCERSVRFYKQQAENNLNLHEAEKKWRSAQATRLELAASENDRLRRELSVTNRWVAQMGRGVAPTIAFGEIGLWLSFFEVNVDEPPRT